MYTTLRFEDFKNRDLSNYKLCYISDISLTYSDYTPETKKYMETEEYSKFKEKYGWSRRDPNIDLKDYPNPDYIPFKQEMFAWFSPQELGDIWGDDFDDIPYECNSGSPYDHDWKEDKEVEIIIVPFSLPKSNKLSIKEPKDYGYNSPFCTEDIILGAVPWIFGRTCKRKGGNKGVAIQAGINPIEFKEKLKEMHDLVSGDDIEIELEGSYPKLGKQLFTISSLYSYDIKSGEIIEYDDDSYSYRDATFLGCEKSSENLINSDIIKEKINEYRKF